MAAGGSKEVLSNAVDAAVTFAYEDPIQLKVKGIEVNAIVASNFFKLYSLGLITNQKLLSTKPEVVSRFTQVTTKAMQYSIANPNESLAAFMRAAPEASIDYEREKLGYFNKLLVSDDASGRSLGRQDMKGWQASLDTMQKLGIVKAKIDPAGKFVPN
jgi:NitT/TauT family transport system substrate-binding protein